MYQTNWYYMQILLANSSYIVTDQGDSQQGNTLDLAISTSADTAYIGIKLKYGSEGTTVVTDNMLKEIKIQIEEGSTATDYEPYKSQTKTVPLNNNFIGKLPNGVKDELSIDKWGNVSLLKKVGKDIVANGSLYDGSTWKGYAFGVPNKVNKLSNSLICNKAKYDGTRSIIENTVYENNANIMFVGNVNDTLETIKAKIDGAEVYYELATPQTINLGKIENLSTYKGVNNIELVTNLGSTFEIEYAQDLQKAIQQLLNSL